jgi:hypothetical protein
MNSSPFTFGFHPAALAHMATKTPLFGRMMGRAQDSRCVLLLLTAPMRLVRSLRECDLCLGQTTAPLLVGPPACNAMC